MLNSAQIMDVMQQRLDNLLRCRRERYNDVTGRLAKAIGRSPSQVYQWISGTRKISEGSARYIERKLRLPEYWMDKEPGAAHAPGKPDPQAIPVGHLPVTTQHLLRELVDTLGARQLPDRDVALLQVIVGHMNSKAHVAGISHRDE